MDLNLIKSISISLMKRDTDIEEGKAEYLKKISAKFEIPENYILNEALTEQIVTSIFDDLLTSAPDEVDSIGLWIEYGSITLENAISLRTLDDISMHSKQNVNPIFEFFKMTLPE